MAWSDDPVLVRKHDGLGTLAGIPASVLMLANVVLPMAIIVLWFTAATVCLVKRSGPAAAVTHRMAPATV